MKAFGTILLLGGAVTLGLPSARCGASDKPATHSGPAYTTKVDWFKGPPKRLDSNLGIRIPSHLIVSVPVALRQEATVLLGEADALLLTNGQVARFGATIDADAILRARIGEVGEKLRFFQEHPVDEDLLRRFGKREFDDMKKRHLTIMNELGVEAKQLSLLEHQLKPYLVKAVALHAGGTFSGTLAGKNLFVSFDAMGSHAVPMERCPAIAFLPTKPRHVYTAVSMTQ